MEVSPSQLISLHIFMAFLPQGWGVDWGVTDKSLSQVSACFLTPLTASHRVGKAR